MVDHRQRFPMAIRSHGRSRGAQGDEEAVTGWTSEELDRIGTARAERGRSTARRRDLRQPVTIWVIREGDDLYSRLVAAGTGAWYRGVQERHQGHIRAGGVDTDVDLVAVDDEELQPADRRRLSGQVRPVRVELRREPMTSGETRTTTLRLEPRAAEGRREHAAITHRPSWSPAPPTASDGRPRRRCSRQHEVVVHARNRDRPRPSRRPRTGAPRPSSGTCPTCGRRATSPAR